MISKSMMKDPEFLKLVIQYSDDGLPLVANDEQFKQIEKLFNAWYKYQEPKLQLEERKSRRVKKKKNPAESSGSSIDSDDIDEDELLK